MKRINIVSVFNWYCNLLDTQTLTSSEQLILVHLMKIFNRNYWKPTNINTSAICRSCGKDSRTVKSALTKLQNKNLITSTKQGLFLNVNGEEEEIKEIPTASSKINTVGNKKAQYSEPEINYQGSPYFNKQDIEEWLQKKREENSKGGLSNIKEILH